MYILFFACLLKVALTFIINTNNGPVSGVPSLAEDLDAFLGIPYAEPPVGELRFAKPIPKRKWTDVYNASTLPPPCAQIGLGTNYYFMPNLTTMSEDCLYLNVWAPRSEPSYGLRPVIVFVHPGAFATGSSNMKVHDGLHLASRGDLVVVTFNYRLGSLGYFLAFVEEANGNMGEFDQILAIKWVKENAKHFNGDPENIVLMGASAGAYSVSGLMVSPLAKSLFNRAIILSGSMMHPFFLDDNARLFKNSQAFASVAGCSNESSTLESDPVSVVQCLKGLPEEELIKAQLVLHLTNPLVFFPKVNDEVFPKSSIDLIREGKFRKDVDVLIGITKNEGSMMLFIAAPDYLGYYGKNQKTITKFRAHAIARGAIYIAGQPNSSEIVNFYMKHVKNRTTTGYLTAVSNLIGDFVASCNTVFFADNVSLKGNRVYFYKLEFRPASAPSAEWVGTTHLDELQYVFGSPYHENLTSEETELSHRVIDRWSAFARTGNPNIPGEIPWLRYSYHTPVYLNMGQEEESIRLKPNDRCEVWRKRFKADIDVELVRHLRNSGMNTSKTNIA